MMKFCFSLLVFLTLTLVWKINSQLLRTPRTVRPPVVTSPRPPVTVPPVLNNDVRTSSGPVRGSTVIFQGVPLRQYLGIPFADPPVDELRFKRPQPVQPWTETYDATKMRPACMHYTEYPLPCYDSEVEKSEDCLYLNIWAPKSDGLGVKKRPVIFWISAEGFSFGSNKHDGRALAAEGDVVVVTVNFRMAAFGFLTSGTESAPGNVGMYDMLEALKWVNKNIAAFGGDPDRVALTGQSSGAIAVGLLAVSPLTNGLFKRVIMESGSPAYLLAENNAANIAKSQKLAEAVNCATNDYTIYDNPEEVVACLRRVDAVTIAKTLASFSRSSARSFYPMYGDEMLPQNARVALRNGDFNNEVDVLIGTNRDEGAFQITMDNPEVFGVFGEKDPKINKSYGESMLRRIFDNNDTAFQDPDAVIQHYLGDVPEDDYDRIRERVYTASGDYSFLCPTVYFAESYSRAGSKVYYYFFVHRPSSTEWAPWMGIVRCEEIQYVFGAPLQNPTAYTPDDILLAKRMIRTWADFARLGNTGRIDWPLYSRENATYVEMTPGPFPMYGQGPHRENCDFFREYFGFSGTNSTTNSTMDDQPDY